MANPDEVNAQYQDHRASSQQETEQYYPREAAVSQPSFNAPSGDAFAGNPLENAPAPSRQDDRPAQDPSTRDSDAMATMRKELDELRATVDATRKGQQGPSREPVHACPNCEDQGHVSVLRDETGPYYACARCGRVGTSKEYAESLNAEEGINPLEAYGGYTIATPSMVMTAQS